MTLNDSINVIFPDSRVVIYQDGHYLDTLEYREYVRCVKGSKINVLSIRALAYNLIRIDV